jgi:hypothetical protein
VFFFFSVPSVQVDEEMIAMRRRKDRAGGDPSPTSMGSTGLENNWTNEGLRETRPIDRPQCSWHTHKSDIKREALAIREKPKEKRRSTTNGSNDREEQVNRSIFPLLLDDRRRNNENQ